jgi:hypothetical protein
MTRVRAMPLAGRVDHLTSAPMSRVRAALLLVIGTLATALGCLLGVGSAAATTPPTAPPVSAVPVAAPASTVPGAALPTTVPATVPPAGSRGGADAGSVVKPKHETWSVQRIIITTALSIIALAAIGYVYGRLRSAPPKHPDLTRRAEDLETTG